MLPVDASVEWPKTEIWSWSKGLLRSFIFTYLSHLNPYNAYLSHLHPYNAYLSHLNPYNVYLSHLNPHNAYLSYLNPYNNIVSNYQTGTACF
jgi:hypothetical protein